MAPTRNSTERPDMSPDLAALSDKQREILAFLHETITRS
jgi:hypothetical protein